MKWNKKGFICSSETFDLDWYKKNTMVPVPHPIDNERLRLFVTMCDSDNVGRVGYVDVDINNPSKILAVSKKPVLDVGPAGYFDDCGVLPSCLFNENGKLYMFYSAYQRHAKIPYSILTGLAVSHDNGESFEKVQQSPILERKDGEMFIRSAAFCIKVQDTYRIYYSSGNTWTHNSKKDVPAYCLKAIETKDILNWNDSKPISIFELENDEYGLTTPNVYVESGIYKMTYSIRSISKGYRIGYAESSDGIHWERKDNQLDLEVSQTGWDSEMICFGNTQTVSDKKYLFYCGNNYGVAGMGYAELSN